ncbi:MAG: Bax inhibitor-1 family protein [Gammaproteobacteria bacterium]|nr:Bax inhibitor-1 family protein [Gammaproteobacteria bacterium]
MNAQDIHARNVTPATIAINKVLRNTYILLSLTLLFSAFTAAISVMQNAAFVNIWILLIVMIGFPFLLNRVKDSPIGLILTFAYTGFIGWYLGPILNIYLHNFSNGSQLITMALGGTGLIFLLLSLLSLNPNKNYTGWGRGLAIGGIVVVIAMLLNVFFFKLPFFQLGLSIVFAFISGGFIMYQTNMIVRGGETNYITATVVLYVSLVNIFLTLLQILGMFGGNRN